MTRHMYQKYKRFWIISVGFVLVMGIASDSYARRMRPTRKASTYEIQFQPNNPKGFYRNLSYILEQQPPSSHAAQQARASMAELLFETENYREAAQIYLQLTEAPLADQYKLSSFQYRLAECYFHMGLYGESYDQFSRVRQAGHKSLEAEATLGMAMAALAQGNRSSAQAHLDILLLENGYYKTYARALYPLGIMLFQNEQYQRSLGFFEKDLEDPKNLYFAAIAYRRMGQIPKALSYFQRLTQKFPQTVWAQRGAFEVAETYYQQQDFQLAYQSFQRWMKEYPNGSLEAESRFRLASTDYKRERYPDTLERLGPLERMDLRPDLAQRVRHLTSESWVQMGKIEELVDRIRKKGRAKDRTPDQNYQLMWALTALGRYQEALSLAEEGLNEFFDHELTPKILLIQGFCYDKVDRPAEALAAYQTVVDRFGNSAYSARALQLMAMNYVKGRRWQELVTHVNHHWEGLPPDIKKEHPEVEFWITEGLLSLGNYELAQLRYQKFLSAAPDHMLTPYAYLGLAVSLAQNKQLDAGFQTLQQFSSIAAQKKRDDWVALATLQSANIFYNQKKYEDAIGYYRAFQADYKDSPEVPHAIYQEAQALYKLEYYTDAVDTWNKLADQFPNYGLTEKARFQAARTLFDLGKTTESVKAFQTFIVKHPASPQVKDARLQLAHALYNAGDFKKAIPKYQEFIALYPNAEEIVSVQDFLQIAYVQSGMSEEEIEQLTKGQVKTQVLADLYWEKGAQAFNDKEYDKALGYFEKILIDFPASTLAPQAAFYRAESLYSQEKFADASAAYKNFLTQFPADEQASTSLFRLGVALFNQNRFEEAAITFENFLTKYPNDPLAQNAAENIPLAYAKIGRAQDSASAYETLLKRTTDPVQRAGLLIQVAQAKEKNGDAVGAIKNYNEVSPAAAEFSEAMYALANIYAQVGQEDSEIQTYEKLVGLPSKDDPYRIAGLSRLAELYIGKGNVQRALAVYTDVASNTKDEASLANAQSRLEELKKVLEQ